MAYDQRARVLTLLTGLGSDFELLTLNLIDEAVSEANRMVAHHYAPRSGFQATVNVPANASEAIFLPGDEVGQAWHINEINSVTQLLAGRSLVVPIVTWAEVRWMQNTEGLIITAGEAKMCGIRKQKSAAPGGTHDTGAGLNPYDGGVWRFALYPRCTTSLLISYDAQAWDSLVDTAHRDNEQKIFMLEEAVRIACATLAPKGGLTPPQIDTLLSGQPEWSHALTQMTRNTLYPWARTVQQARMG